MAMNRAKQLRIDRHLGLLDAAESAGVAYRTLKKVEDGQEPTAKVLARLSTFYGVKASELLRPAHFDYEPPEEAA
jgi:transcriptional regulator with XRE-family HTH domain